MPNEELRKLGKLAYIQIRPMPAGGFAIVSSDQYARGDGSIGVAACTSVGELLAVIGEIYGDPTLERVVTDGAEAEAPMESNARPIESAFVVRRMSERARANAVFRLNGVEYAFVDETAAKIAYLAVCDTGAEARWIKARGGKIEMAADPKPDFAEVGETVDAADDHPGSPVWVIASGPVEDPNRTVTVFYDENTAKITAKAIWEAGGKAHLIPARYI